ncbi:hypothetical protein F4779DRAFT_603918 [Xylariaceae sp. FL0662B]|nr:hypothetical protein F4779DRAFT_603918 [Xylariaceae sp. FL0662B]
MVTAYLDTILLSPITYTDSLGCLLRCWRLERMEVWKQDMRDIHRACDRCHFHKLKCEREDSSRDDSSCIRCSRAKAHCVTSAVRSRKRTRARSSVRSAYNSPTTATPNTIRDLTPVEGSDEPSSGNPNHFSTWPESLLHIPADLDLNFGQCAEVCLDRGPRRPTTEYNMFQTVTPNQELDSGFMEDTHGSGFTSSAQGHLTPCSSVSLSASVNMSPYIPGSTFPESRNQQTSPVYRPGNGNIQTNNNADRANLGNGTSHAASVLGISVTGGSDITQENLDVSTPRTEDITSWMKRLSELNIELHSHMLSIPPLGIWQRSWTDPDKASPGYEAIQRDKVLAMDRTLHLSQEYTEILNYIFPRFRHRQKGVDRPTAPIQLDPPSELVVLSGYLSIIETYDKLLQHIRACAEARLDADPEEAEAQAPICLPSFSVGSFRMTSSSSVQVVVLLHLIQEMMTRVREIIDDMIRRGSSGNGLEKTHTDTSRPPHSEVLSITKVTHEAIRKKEESTMQLLRIVTNLALKCGVI